MDCELGERDPQGWPSWPRKVSRPTIISFHLIKHAGSIAKIDDFITTTTIMCADLRWVGYLLQTLVSCTNYRLRQPAPLPSANTKDC